MTILTKNDIRNALLGVIVGDALGVPVEFKSRKQIAENPVKDMIGYGTYNLPAGTWSDDSSMMLCTAEILQGGFDLNDIAQNFVRWVYENHWTPRGYVFDIGISTQNAVVRLKEGESPKISGNVGEMSNGNGSLMRILPILFHVKDVLSPQERYEIISDVSNITHAHVRSRLACFHYIEMARFILDGADVQSALKHANESLLNLFRTLHIAERERVHFDRLFEDNFEILAENQIASSGYVIHSLEASIWCLLTTNSYSEAVLKAVNLGDDTDTTAAITGGLAGLYYGAEAIPQHWINGLARIEDIEALITAWNAKL